MSVRRSTSTVSSVESKPDPRDSGMITAETAVVLPVLTVVLCGALGLISVFMAQLRCIDAAREGARAAARSEPDSVVRALVNQVAPQGSHVDLRSEGEKVIVTVTGVVKPLGSWLPSFKVHSRAVGLHEPEELK